jgi:hypothetical protein
LLVVEARRLGAVVAVCRRHLQRRDKAPVAARRGVDLVAIKALAGGLAAVAHLGVDHRHDPPLGDPAAKARHIVRVDLEVLAGQLAQHGAGLGDRRRARQLGLGLDGGQRPARVLGDPGEHRLAGGFAAPVALGLLAWAGIVELEAAAQRLGRLRVGAGHRPDQLGHPRAHQAHRVLGGGRPQHRRRVEDLLGRALHQPEPGGQLN